MIHTLRAVLIVVFVVGIIGSEASLAGNALTSGSSYVGPAGTVSRPMTRKRAPRVNENLVAKPAARAPLRTAAPWQPPPTTSPFLNMFRPEATPIFNYYTLVRPQLQQLEINNRQAAEIQQLQQLINSGGGGRARSAHETRFMNHGTYFSGSR
jgi:hypothetical protein